MQEAVSVDLPVSGSSAPDSLATAEATVEDFRSFDLISRMKEAGIKVLCLDEAHHLRSEWHKALVAFIKAMDDDFIVISLTATPPYDSGISEWKRYESLCGPIDEEIFVPELVLKKTLCPHQDYIYFSYPTESEKEALKKYRQHAQECLSEIDETKLIERALQSSGTFDLHARLDIILKNEADFFTLFRMAERFGVTLPPEIFKMVKKRSRFKQSLSWRKSWKEFETALQFVVDKPEIFTPEISEELRSLVARHGLLERRKVRLLSDSKLTRMLVSSMGKLQGISQVVVNETANMGDSLRMLVLTDFIKKEMLHIVGTDAVISTMGAVPIFESIRRTVGEGTKLAMLSGSLVIVPNESKEHIAMIARKKQLPCSFRPLPGVDYSEALFQGSNKNKVAVMTEAFQQGHINILVGTKSLLGEGWDSPCINTLILATFVGSFMLSNQMRGRAIRVDHQVPDKTANIWHLVTLEPVIDPDANLQTKLMFSGLEKSRELDGDDWETLIRRFDCFMGPAYSRATVESGVERIDILKPPFDRKGIESINAEMEVRARNREAMAKSWMGASPAGFYPVVEAVTEAPDTKLPTSFVLQNVLPLVVMTVIEVGLGFSLYSSFLRSRIGGGEGDLFMGIIVLAAFALVALGLARGAVRALRLLSPKRTVTSIAEAMLASLRQAGHVRSLGAKIQVSALPGDACISFGLRQATIHEQNVFAQAMSEALSPIENPKYLLIRTQGGRPLHRQSYACPTILAAKKEDAELLRENLSHLMGPFRLVYTYNTEGRELLWKSCCRSYVNANAEILKKLTTWASG